MKINSKKIAFNILERSRVSGVLKEGLLLHEISAWLEKVINVWPDPNEAHKACFEKGINDDPVKVWFSCLSWMIERQYKALAEDGSSGEQVKFGTSVCKHGIPTDRICEFCK